MKRTEIFDDSAADGRAKARGAATRSTTVIHMVVAAVVAGVQRSISRGVDDDLLRPICCGLPPTCSVFGDGNDEGSVWV